MSGVHRGPRALTWLLDALGEPTRRRAYEVVREAHRPVSRADAAQALGIGVRLAAFHLDKLVEQGLLGAFYAREEGARTGPGAGRPPKWYVTGAHGFDITLPPRRHDLAATILLRAVAVVRPSGNGREELLRQARRRGRSLAEETPGATLGAVLSDLGYEPRPAPRSCIDLLNCPFHELAQENRELICAMNLALLKGVTDVVPDRHVALPEQREGYCCIRLVPATNP